MKYRPAIDGLRAVAVVPVILFHAGVSTFSGGFVGVDVFFVISGYLITTIIIDELARGRFNLLTFYERRARRILPALVLVVVATMPFAWWLLLPSEMKDYSQSLMAVATFSSNILFWRESGYFETAAELKPLLHTWSLAVEEQYYIFFPLLLMAAWRFGRRWLIPFLVVIFVASLTLAQWTAYNDAAAGFFLLPTRGWELLVGSFVAFWLRERRSPRAISLHQWLSALGLAMIVFACLWFDGTMPFPSVWTLIPTLGAALVILFAIDGTWVCALLVNRMIVGIGLLSYSAYLWHQPLFAFARYGWSRHLGLLQITILVAATFTLAWWSWRFVERPFRQKGRIARAPLFRMSASALAILLVSGGVVTAKQGNFYRVSEADMDIVGFMEERDTFVWRNKEASRHRPFDDAKPIKMLLIGDSNSGDLLNLLMMPAPADVTFSSLTIYKGCGNLYLEPERYRSHIEPRLFSTCYRADSYFSPQTEALLAQADVVVLAMAWQEFEVELLLESLSALTKRFGPKFLVFGDKQMTYTPETVRQKPVPARYALKVAPQADRRALNDRLRAMLGRRFVDPYDYLCEADQCPLFDEQGKLIYFDGFHLTPAGAGFAAKRMTVRTLLARLPNLD
ncbi:MAG: acyltransferase family protein [Burkholderiaceae bacterium]